MAGEWSRQPLGKHLSAIIDYRGKTPPKAPVGIPTLTAANVKAGRVSLDDLSFVSPETYKRWTTRGFPEPGDVLITTEAPVGEVASFPADGTYLITRRLIALRPDGKNLDKSFLKYSLLNRKTIDRLLASVRGSTVPRVLKTDITGLEISLPPMATQRVIANILGTLDDKIELNRRMNETLEAMARALFKSWFVDFDPVRAKMDGKQPKGMSPEIAALFPDGFEQVDGELVPKGWKKTRLADEIGFQGGFAFKSKDWRDEGVPVVKIGSVKPGIIDLDQVSFVAEEIARRSSRYRLGVGDLLIGMTGYVGEVGIVPPANLLPLLNQRVGKFVLPTSGTSSLAFWYCTTRQPEFRSFVEGRSHGTAQANVSAKGIMDYTLAVPTDILMERFNSTCAPMFARILGNQGQIRVLADLRDTLLPKLLSGEIRVGDAERVVEEVI